MRTEWLTVDEAAAHAKCGKRSIYLAVQHRKIQVARLGGRRELRFLASWVDRSFSLRRASIVYWAPNGGDTGQNKVQFLAALKQ